MTTGVKLDATAETARVEITGVAAGGDGVGRAEGMVVFVPRTAPGDVAHVRLTAAKRFARGQLESLERASPLRIEPPCPHYTRDRCGGCQLQHLAYDAQVAAKGAIIGDALRRLGRRDVPDPVVEPSDAPWRYRRKLTLHVRGSGSDRIAGLHPYDDPVAVFDLEDCPITDVRVLEVWRALRAAFDDLPRERVLRVAVRLVSGAGGGRRWWSKEVANGANHSACSTASPRSRSCGGRPTGDDRGSSRAGRMSHTPAPRSSR